VVSAAKRGAAAVPLRVRWLLTGRKRSTKTGKEETEKKEKDTKQ
jgi:hypothetical protein